MEQLSELSGQLPDQAGLSAQAILNVIILLVSVGASWWALQSFRFDLLLRQPKSAQGKLLHVLLSVALGYQVAKFLIDYFELTSFFKMLA